MTIIHGWVCIPEEPGISSWRSSYSATTPRGSCCYNKFIQTSTFVAYLWKKGQIIKTYSLHYVNYPVSKISLKIKIIILTFYLWVLKKWTDWTKSSKGIKIKKAIEKEKNITIHTLTPYRTKQLILPTIFLKENKIIYSWYVQKTTFWSWN